MGGFKDVYRFIMGWWGARATAPPEPTCICVSWAEPTYAAAWGEPAALAVSWEESNSIPVLWDRGCDC